MIEMRMSLRVAVREVRVVAACWNAKKKSHHSEYSATVVLSRYEMLSSICYCKLTNALQVDLR